MSQFYNDFNIKRTAFASFTYPNSSAATTVYSSAIIPTGAIVTGVRYIAPTAVTLTGASGTVLLQVGTTTGSVALLSTSNASQLAASATPTIAALATTAGIFVATGGVLCLVCQASSNAAATAIYDFYVDYMYTGIHD